MKKRGVELISYFQVDNPLAAIIDPVFVGFHVLKNAEMSTKVVKKISSDEKVGVVCLINKKLGVVEYSDLPPEKMYAKNPNNELVFSAGNIAIHILGIDFVESLNKNGFALPFHKAIKNIPTFKGEVQGVKFEIFVFDALQYAKNSVTLE
ncbi:MAG: UTP--glucose-1-phosphate uridylyltransferase, partial [Candidatus Omnitrophica bacterium]|nr:UTP--glucose-1-phosphate uridylyltransferase [Candidatus Omnitrophota bacterium]